MTLPLRVITTSPGWYTQAESDFCEKTATCVAGADIKEVCHARTCYDFDFAFLHHDVYVGCVASPNGFLEQWS